MALGQRVEMTLDGAEPVTVSYDARDLIAYEAVFSRSVIGTRMDLTMLTWLGWHAAERTGALNGSGETWEKFKDVVTGIQVVDDPPTRARKSTRKAASPGSTAP